LPDALNRPTPVFRDAAEIVSPPQDDASQPADGADEAGDASAIGNLVSQWKIIIEWVAVRLSFWTIVPFIGLLGFIYLILFTDSLYNSQAIFNLQNASSVSTSLSSLGSSLLGGASSSNQSGSVVAYIESHEMLQSLDKKFHLRQLYSSTSHSPFWRLSPGASDADFLTFYQGMVTVTQDQSSGLITISVLDYDAKRAHEITDAILVAAQDFVNNMSSSMRTATIKYAQDQLVAATKAVETAQPYERSVAEAELTAAQQAMAAAQGLANQQQVFLIRISNPTTPTDTSVPDRLLAEAAILLAAAVLYMVGHLLLANVRDHRNA
jgi:capsule polysaccharide export protein KpsE/RkpR